MFFVFDVFCANHGAKAHTHALLCQYTTLRHLRGGILAIRRACQTDPPSSLQPRAGAAGVLPGLPRVPLGWAAASRPGVQRAEERAGVRAAAPARRAPCQGGRDEPGWSDDRR